jgi:ribose 5-phosphate isomerase B
MKIYIGADHNGFNFKKQISEYLTSLNNEVVDGGDVKLDPDDDFPRFASRVVHKILGDEGSVGILICGSGQGMCMAANRYKGIRASLCWNVKEAHDARNDDNSNVLCLSANQMSLADLKQIINVWLNTPFAKAPRFVRRLQELDSLG